MMGLKFLLVLIVILTPLLGATSTFGFEESKVIFFLLLTTISGLLWLYKKPKVEWTLINKSAALFLLALLVTSLLGINPVGSILGKPPYFQGLILYAYLFLFSLMVSQSNINLKTWAIFLSISGSLVSLVGLEQWVSLLQGFQIPTYAGRVVSTFGQPNFYAGFLLMILPLTYSLTSKSRWWWISLVCATAAILISFSRIGVSVLILIIFSLLISRLQPKVRYIVAGLSALGVIFTILLSFNLAIGPVWGEFTDPQGKLDRTDYSSEKRIYLWEVMTKFVMIRSLVGYGLENIGTSYESFIKNLDFNSVTNPIFYDLKNLTVDRAHSYPLDLLLYSGIAGLGSWVILVLIMINQMIKQRKQPMLMVSLIIYLAWSLVQVQSIAHLMFFWLIVGLIDPD